MNVSSKHITLMGLGILGRGLNVAKFLLERGANLIITDLKTAEQLQSSIDQLAEYESQIEYVLGRHRVKDFIETDMVVKAAGVPLGNKYIQAARDNNITVKMDASWAVTELPPGVVTVGVTGTKGKSSVTHLLHHILTTAGLSVYLGGNVQGQATLPILDHIKTGNYLLMELDSWQLQGFRDEQISPHISVFTNFMPDHLNYYSGMPEYFHDKAAIYEYQSKSDRLVLSPSSFEAIRAYGGTKPVAMTAIVKPSILMKDWQFTQPGNHNRLNAAQAYQVAKFLNVADKDIKTALETFPGVPGRLQHVETINGVRYYNDTNATTPEATASSVRAICQTVGKPVVICGGVSKNFPGFDPLIHALNECAAHVVLFPGGIADAIRDKLEIGYDEVSNMQEAIKSAVSRVGELDAAAVVMSPAGSSFGLFKNEYDRGDQFNRAVAELK